VTGRTADMASEQIGHIEWTEQTEQIGHVEWTDQTEQTKRTLNRLLVYFFKYIMELEEKKLITDEFRDISYHDMHVIEAIGKNESGKMSEIAKVMSVTTGTLTRTIDSLEKKGYVRRRRSSQDKRVVHIALTDRGVHAFEHHERFHQDMIAYILQGLSVEESVVLKDALEKLMVYFQQKYK